VNVPLVSAGVFAGSALLAAGTTLAIQAFGDEPIATVQKTPRGANHIGGAGAGVAAVVGASFIAARAGTARVGVPAITSAVAGAGAGAYLLAPAIRRYLAEH
jgi:hypothetical protein